MIYLDRRELRQLLRVARGLQRCRLGEVSGRGGLRGCPRRHEKQLHT